MHNRQCYAEKYPFDLSPAAYDDALFLDQDDDHHGYCDGHADQHPSNLLQPAHPPPQTKLLQLLSAQPH